MVVQLVLAWMGILGLLIGTPWTIMVSGMPRLPGIVILSVGVICIAVVLALPDPPEHSKEAAPAPMDPAHKG